VTHQIVIIISQLYFGHFYTLLNIHKRCLLLFTVLRSGVRFHMSIKLVCVVHNSIKVTSVWSPWWDVRRLVLDELLWVCDVVFTCCHRHDLTWLCTLLCL